MNSVFFYPTKKNVFIGFCISQLLPLLVLWSVNSTGDIVGWLQFELIIIGCLCMWQLKPMKEFDERERDITLKWKSRMLDFGSSLILIPIVLLSINPGIEGWTLYSLSAIPVFVLFIFCSLMAKKEFGYFFVSN